MVHETVDIDSWNALFPLEAELGSLDALGAGEHRYRTPYDIFSPKDLALTEQMRQRAGFHAESRRFFNRLARRFRPVDYLLPALGEPPRREMSKIGGLPYRPRGAWPTGSDGRPMSFIAQLCLADSRAILRRAVTEHLGGDVLLIFQEGGDWSRDEGDGVPLRFEWQPLSLAAQDLVTPEEIPGQEIQWSPLYFQLHRTRECEDWEGTFPSPAGKPVGVDGASRASKIGGVPAWQQGESGKGTFFASIHSVNPCGTGVEGTRFPFPNLEAPTWRWASDAGFFMLGDVGTLYLFMRPNGSSIGSSNVGDGVACGDSRMKTGRAVSGAARLGLYSDLSRGRDQRCVKSSGVPEAGAVAGAGVWPKKKPPKPPMEMSSVL